LHYHSLRSLADEAITYEAPRDRVSQSRRAAQSPKLAPKAGLTVIYQAEAPAEDIARLAVEPTIGDWPILRSADGYRVSWRQQADYDCYYAEPP
jgi:hypothetical protein